MLEALRTFNAGSLKIMAQARKLQVSTMEPPWRLKKCHQKAMMPGNTEEKSTEAFKVARRFFHENRGLWIEGQGGCEWFVSPFFNGNSWELVKSLQLPALHVESIEFKEMTLIHQVPMVNHGEPSKIMPGQPAHHRSVAWWPKIGIYSSCKWKRRSIYNSIMFDTGIVFDFWYCFYIIDEVL